MSSETIEALGMLIDQARSGDVVGIAFVALHATGEFSTGITGRARQRPVLTRGMLDELHDELHEIHTQGQTG